MTSSRVLGCCGLLAALLTMASPIVHSTAPLGFAGALMVAANLFALVRG